MTTGNNSEPSGSMRRWAREEGAIYEIIRERLYFTAHPDDTYTITQIRHFPRLFFFSSDLPGMFARAMRRFSSPPGSAYNPPRPQDANCDNRDVPELLPGFWPYQHRPRHPFLQVRLNSARDQARTSAPRLQRIARGS